MDSSSRSNTVNNDNHSLIHVISSEERGDIDSKNKTDVIHKKASSSSLHSKSSKSSKKYKKLYRSKKNRDDENRPLPSTWDMRYCHEENTQLRRVNHTVVTYNSCLYVYGGRQLQPLELRKVARKGQTSGEGQYLHGVFEYSFKTMMWEDIQNNDSTRSSGYLPVQRGDHSAVVYSDTMIVFGGRKTGNISLSDIVVFNFNTKLWSKIKDESECGPGPVFCHCAAVSPSGKMYIIGGVHQELHTELLFIFDIKTKTWEKVPGPININPNNIHIVEIALDTGPNHEVQVQKSSPFQETNHLLNITRCNSYVDNSNYGSFSDGRLFVFGLEENDSALFQEIECQRRPFLMGLERPKGLYEDCHTTSNMGNRHRGQMDLQHIHVFDTATFTWKKVFTTASPVSPIPFRISELKLCFRKNGLWCCGSAYNEETMRWHFVTRTPQCDIGQAGYAEEETRNTTSCWTSIVGEKKSGDLKIDQYLVRSHRNQSLKAYLPPCVMFVCDLKSMTWFMSSVVDPMELQAGEGSGSEVMTQDTNVRRVSFGLLDRTKIERKFRIFFFNFDPLAITASSKSKRRKISSVQSESVLIAIGGCDDNSDRVFVQLVGTSANSSELHQTPLPFKLNQSLSHTSQNKNINESLSAHRTKEKSHVVCICEEEQFIPFIIPHSLHEAPAHRTGRGVNRMASHTTSKRSGQQSKNSRYPALHIRNSSVASAWYNQNYLSERKWMMEELQITTNFLNDISVSVEKQTSSQSYRSVKLQDSPISQQSSGEEQKRIAHQKVTEMANLTSPLFVST